MQHQFSEEQNTTVLLSSPAALLPPSAQALLSGALEQFEESACPAAQARLQELVQAHLELEDSPLQAVQIAIHQLQRETAATPETTTLPQPGILSSAKSVHKSIHRRRPLDVKSNIRALSSSGSVRKSTLIALKVFGSAAVATTFFNILFAGTTNLALYLLLMFTMFGLPVAAGAAVGLRTHHKPVIGTFYALALLFPLKMLLDYGAMLRGAFGWDGLAWMAIDFVLFWIPLGCLAVALTAWGHDLLHLRNLRRIRS